MRTGSGLSHNRETPVEHASAYDHTDNRVRTGSWNAAFKGGKKLAAPEGLGHTIVERQAVSGAQAASIVTLIIMPAALLFRK